MELHRYYISLMTRPAVFFLAMYFLCTHVHSQKIHLDHETTYMYTYVPVTITTFTCTWRSEKGLAKLDLTNIHQLFSPLYTRVSHHSTVILTFALP